MRKNKDTLELKCPTHFHEIVSQFHDRIAFVNYTFFYKLQTNFKTNERKHVNTMYLITKKCLSFVIYLIFYVGFSVICWRSQRPRNVLRLAAQAAPGGNSLVPNLPSGYGYDYVIVTFTNYVIVTFTN